ncbi:MAG: Fic family protein, partial [bacterium]|nr:Fic family protein [bacterium]
ELFEQQRPEVLESLRSTARIESSESSNRLEGIVAPHARVRDLVMESTQPRNRSEQEIAGYRDALNLIHESRESMPVTTSVILQLHSMLYRYLPLEGGRWKMADNEIVERDPHGEISRVRFKTVSAHLTSAAMDELIGGYSSETQAGTHDPLSIIPLVILDFLCVHPFGDGNGRISRLLTLLLLYHFDYKVARFISLERIFEDSKETYYETLEQSSAGWHESAHDPNPWMNYFWGVLLRAYQEFEERVEHVSSGRGSKSEQVRRAVLARTQPFAISELERDCPGVSRDTIRQALRSMRDSGIIVSQGRGPGARWHRVEP